MKSDLRQVLTKLNKQGMISYIKSNPNEFTGLIKLSLSDDHPYSWRAAWLLWSVMEINDKHLRRYLSKITDIIPDRADSHQRELIIILQKMQLPEPLTGRIFDLCAALWSDPVKSHSLRYNAFKLMVKISDNYPELRSELHLLAEDESTATLSSSARRCITNMLKLKAL